MAQNVDILQLYRFYNYTIIFHTYKSSCFIMVTYLPCESGGRMKSDPLLTRESGSSSSWQLPVAVRAFT